MKKILLATTLLVAGASVAAAEVTLSGDARMGLLNGFVHGAGVDATQFTSRARVSFGLAGESDSGLAFGGSFRADNAGDASRGTAGSVFISGAFGKLSMGDVDGGAQQAVGHVDGVGLTGLGDQNENVFIGAGGFAFGPLTGLVPATQAANPVTGDPTVAYEYTTGALSFYASLSQPGFRLTVPAGNVADPAFGGGAPLFVGGDVIEGDAASVGAAYKLNDYKFSLGYEKMNLDRRVGGARAVDIDHLIGGIDATFGQIAVKARYGKADADVDNVAALKFEQAALSATYTMDAIKVTAFTRDSQWKTPAGVNVRDVNAIGLGASYDLGGGASVKGGVVRQSVRVGAAAKTSDTAFDLGVSLSF